MIGAIAGDRIKNTLTEIDQESKEVKKEVLKTLGDITT
jgi:hypothetical protein